jgi:hypothetical protein
MRFGCGPSKIIFDYGHPEAHWNVAGIRVKKLAITMIGSFRSILLGVLEELTEFCRSPGGEYDTGPNL